MDGQNSLRTANANFRTKQVMLKTSDNEPKIIYTVY